MGRLIDADYSQEFLFPPSIEDWVGPDHPARFVRDFVAQLDLDALGFAAQDPGGDGRPPYSNALLLRVWVFAYMSRIRSTRKLEAALRNQMPFIWLAGMHQPDHNTLWRFWRQNKKALKQVFRQSVRVAQQLGLVQMALHALDGTKIKALSARKRALHAAELKALLQAIEESIESMEQAVEAEGHNEALGYGLPDTLQDAAARREQILNALALLEEEGQKHLQPQEQEARMMKTQDGIDWAYNAQAVVDAHAGIIVAQDVNNEATDYGQLAPMLEQVQDNTGGNAGATVADSGYRNIRQQAQVHEQGCTTILPAHGKDTNPANPYDKSHFLYNAESDTYTCPQGQTLHFSSLNTRRGETGRVYRCRACKHCPVRAHCTSNKDMRTIRRNANEAFMEEQAQLRNSEEGRNLLARRKGLIEPLFGHIKHNLQFRRWEARGLENAQAQWSLTCLAINLTKIYKHWKGCGKTPESPKTRKSHTPKLPWHHHAAPVATPATIKSNWTIRIPTTQAA